MSNVYDVDPQQINRRVATALKDRIKKPEFVNYVKSGPSKERAPSDPDFWFVRSASILRQIYMNGPVGTSRLRTRYGTRKSHGSSRKHHVGAGGSIIRKSLQELEKAGFVEKTPKGRVVTPSGMSFLDKMSKELKASS